MTISHDQFVQALNYLVSIEPDPTTYQDMDEYDVMMTPYEPEIAKAHATIRGYGAQIAPQGLEHMQNLLSGVLEQPESCSMKTTDCHKKYNPRKTRLNS